MMSTTISSDAFPASPSKGRPYRRLARQLALQMLLQSEFQGQNPSWKEKFWASQSDSSTVQTFASNLHQGVLDHQGEIDQIIRKFAVDWSLERMPVVDRNILRCAIYEFLWEPDIPARVTINEAIELAKRFADDETKRFVNGILDHVLHDEIRLENKRRQEDSPAPVPESSDSTPTS